MAEVNDMGKLNIWQWIVKTFNEKPHGFYVAFILAGAWFFLKKGEGSEGKWQVLYEHERQTTSECGHRYDSLQREYNLFLKGYAPLVQQQIERTENLKDSIKNNSHEQD